MTILPNLIALYRRFGYEPVTGYNSYHFHNYMNAPFTGFLKDGRFYGSYGLALQEVMFLEHFRDYLQPRSILVIGNAYGWSTLALALIFPGARVVAIDPFQDGNALTNALARANGLDAIAVDGHSPVDVAAVAAAHLPGPLDLCLIDAVHDGESIQRDFAACLPLLDARGVVLFHDVINWGLVEAFNRIRAQPGVEGMVLTRTPSGMAVAWREVEAAFLDYLSVFSEPPGIFAIYRQVCQGLSDPLAPVLKGIAGGPPG